MRCAPWIVASVMAVTQVAAAAAPPGGDGFNVADGAVPWSRWQARVSLATLPASWRSERLAANGAGLTLQGASVLGDYYFGPSAIGRPAGFRATSGLLLGARQAMSARLADGAGYGLQPAGRRGGGIESPAWSSSAEALAEPGTTPYLGVGYTGGSAKGSLSFSADLGVMAVGAGAGLRPGRKLDGAASLDDVLRDMRLSPVLQLGVSYAF